MNEELQANEYQQEKTEQNMSIFLNRRLNRSNDNDTCFSGVNTPCNHEERYAIPLPAVIAFLIAVLMIGLAGNSIVVIVISLKRKMRTFTNVLILNLALADLLVALFCIPLEIPLELNHKWIYGNVFCRVFYPIQSATVYGSVFTLVALSLSRYWAILHPYNKQPGKSMAKMLVMIIWLASIILVTPYAIGLEYDEGDRECKEVWSEIPRKVFTLATFLLQYIIPLTIMTIAYSCIIHEMTTKKKATPYEHANKERQDEGRRLTKLLLIITFTFALCMLPYHIIAFSYEFADANLFNYIEDVSVASYLLLYLNSALNPIIYNTYSSNFREVFDRLFRSYLGDIRIFSCGSKRTEISLRQKKKTEESYFYSDEYLDFLANFDQLRETAA